MVAGQSTGSLSTMQCRFGRWSRSRSASATAIPAAARAAPAVRADRGDLAPRGRRRPPPPDVPPRSPAPRVSRARRRGCSGYSPIAAAPDRASVPQAPRGGGDRLLQPAAMQAIELRRCAVTAAPAPDLVYMHEHTQAPDHGPDDWPTARLRAIRQPLASMSPDGERPVASPG